MRSLCVFVFLCLYTTLLLGQEIAGDSINVTTYQSSGVGCCLVSDSVTESCQIEKAELVTANQKTNKKLNPYRFRPLQLIIPATMIGVGVIGLESHWLIGQNHEIKEELQENIDKKITIDDFTQFMPTVAIYGLDLFGVKGLHSPAEQTILLGTSALLMGAAVNIIKTTSNVQRPDGSAYNSFPSGHTATAFMGAELLRREYWNVSPWIGVAGYAVATGTGFFRMYNNRHWFTDVIAGAGIGILSVEIAYWLYPFISKTFFKKLYNKNIYLSPSVGKNNIGLNASITF